MSLVFVDTLDLYIVKCVDWDLDSGLLLDPLREPLFIISLYLDKFLDEVRVGLESCQTLQVLQARDPLVHASDRVGDEVGKSAVAAVDPAPRCDTVGLVLNLAWVKLLKF